MQKTNNAFKGYGHLEKSLKGVELSNCTVLLETQATSSPKPAGYYYNNKQGHNKRATCQFLQPQKLLTLLWICFVWRTVKIISLSWGIMRTIQLARFKQTESTATSVGSPGFLSVVSVFIHPWKNRLQAEKRGSHSQVKSKLAEWGQRFSSETTYAYRRAQTHTHTRSDSSSDSGSHVVQYFALYFPSFMIDGGFLPCQNSFCSIHRRHLTWSAFLELRSLP